MIFNGREITEELFVLDDSNLNHDGLFEHRTKEEYKITKGLLDHETGHVLWPDTSYFFDIGQMFTFATNITYRKTIIPFYGEGNVNKWGLFTDEIKPMTDRFLESNEVAVSCPAS